MTAAQMMRDALDFIEAKLWNASNDAWPECPMDEGSMEILESMNPMQLKTVRLLLTSYWRHAAYYENTTKHEWKELRLERVSERTIAMYAVMGLKGDEGSAAEIFCRRRGQFFIGRRGGLRFYGEGCARRGKKDLVSFLITGK